MEVGLGSLSRQAGSLGQDTLWSLVWLLLFIREQLLPSVTILPGHTAPPNTAPQEADPI